MILGIGTDIVEIRRIHEVLKRYTERFLNRIFTPYEQEYCLKRKEPARHLAARFAIKESVAKALGTGFCSKLSWTDIEIRNDEAGKPCVFFPPATSRLFNLSQSTFLVSISHCCEYATAFVVWTESHDSAPSTHPILNSKSESIEKLNQ